MLIKYTQITLRHYFQLISYDKFLKNLNRHF